METIKNAMQDALQKDHGPGVDIALETVDGICFKVYLPKYPEYATYIREGAKGHEIHCYYIHKEDHAEIYNNFTKCTEYRSYREQSIMQLLRQYKGRRDDLVDTARAYMKEATHRMWGYRLIGGSRKSSRVETFEEAKIFHKYNPMPALPKEKTLEEERKEREEKRKAFTKRKPLTRLQKQIIAYQATRLKR